MLLQVHYDINNIAKQSVISGSCRNEVIKGGKEGEKYTQSFCACHNWSFEIFRKSSVVVLLSSGDPAERNVITCR